MNLNSQGNREILRWVSPLEPQLRHQDVKSKRLGTTGNWFLYLELPEMSGRRSSRDKRLWLLWNSWCSKNGHKLSSHRPSIFKIQKR
ncbi:Protein of unknown function [Pyronema omphalodes CBS 100304]|uniref:Uncharacterized protein n=1 Tax=Pyronema omphalodes (strain CBS 100304) TaxID=1076935 RepID=U4LS08_PYROM|nr:Protein of unknown function [Pyronema omphalodes CBS 100304]